MTAVFKAIPAADDDRWTLAEGELNGLPTMIRFRPGLADALGHPAFPRRLIITFTYGDDGQTGMPDDAQSAVLGAFEDTLNAVLDPDRLAVLAFVVTQQGVREWHYYLADAGTVGARINQALADQPGLPLHLQVVDDPQWEEFASVLQGAHDPA